MPGIAAALPDWPAANLSDEPRFAGGVQDCTGLWTELNLFPAFASKGPLVRVCGEINFATDQRDQSSPNRSRYGQEGEGRDCNHAC